MKKQLIDRIPFSRIALILSVTALISLGSCGISLTIDSPSSRKHFLGKLSEVLIMAGVAGFWLSMLGLVLLLIFFIVLVTFQDGGNTR
jgi:hypothetical protein